MKKLLFVAILGTLVACGETSSETTTSDTTVISDSTMVVTDTTVSVDTMAVPSDTAH